jgi:hypothetical protein
VTDKNDKGKAGEDFKWDEDWASALDEWETDAFSAKHIDEQALKPSVPPALSLDVQSTDVQSIDVQSTSASKSEAERLDSETRPWRPSVPSQTGESAIGDPETASLDGILASSPELAASESSANIEFFAPSPPSSKGPMLGTATQAQLAVTEIDDSAMTVELPKLSEASVTGKTVLLPAVTLDSLDAAPARTASEHLTNKTVEIKLPKAKPVSTAALAEPKTRSAPPAEDLVFNEPAQHTLRPEVAERLEARARFFMREARQRSADAGVRL